MTAKHEAGSPGRGSVSPGKSGRSARDAATREASPPQDGAGVCGLGDQEIFVLIELLFFAYRDFVNDPDAILARLNFGRAHHRVLHFVSRYPGLRVADLLSVLRVLKQLVESGYILQEPGAADRRERLLYPTGKGRALSAELAAPQLARVRHALTAAGPGAAASVGRFLNQMISQNGREEAARLMRAGAEARIRGEAQTGGCAQAGATSGGLFNGAVNDDGNDDGGDAGREG
jgi:DNA-binding MarR family transcriptional regulator